MICVYDVGENHYDRLGSCVLTPIKGSHRQIAGGSYELTLEHPIDAGGKWTHLQNGAILKVPVPEETIEDAMEGLAADIYRTVAEAELREEPSEPQRINYGEWNPSNSYTVGSKVTCSGWNHRNWQCTFYDETSPQTYVPPYNNNSWWKQIADYTSGSPVIVKLPAGETLYLVEAGEGWYQVITPYGVQGYIKADKVEFVKHVEPGEITSHVITEQLFRITEVDIDNEANKVTVKARHVSYDLNGILCEDMEISQASAAMAISRIAQGLMMDYNGAIATNLTDTAGTYTQSIKGRNGGFCLLDPDRGVLPAFGAMLKRDNWDVFIMKKKHTDRGYRIRYGKNAKGINWQRKVQDLVTRVVPVAKNEDGSNLYLPEKWVDSTHIGEYPTVIMEWLRVDGQVGKDDGTGTDTVWTAENLYTEMRTKAGERFSVDKVDIPAEEVTVNFEQLGDTAEYPWMRERETILLYDKIQAIDERIGLRMDLYVTEIEYDIIRQKVTGVKLSNTDSYRERTVTGFNVQDNSITPRKLTDEVKDSFMASAVGVMPNYANANTWKPNTASTEGYVQKGEGNENKVWATNGNGEPGWRTPGTYSLPLATDGTRGGVQIGYTQSGKNYPVQLDGEKMYVNVPWSQRPVVDNLTSTDTDKSLSANQGKVLNDTKFDKTGGTVYNSARETPLSIKSNSGTAYIGFINSSDEYNGWLYITSGHKAGAYYNSGFHHFALESDAVKSISRSGTTFTATRCDGTTFTFDQQDTNTWRGIQNNLTSTSTTDSLSAAMGKKLNDEKLPYTGGTLKGSTDTPLYIQSGNSQRAFIGFKQQDGTVNGYMYATEANKAGLYYNSAYHHFAWESEAIKNITRSGTTFTVTRCDGTTFTFTQQDTDTKSSYALTDVALTWSGSYTGGDYMLIHNGETGSGGGALFRAINRANTAAWVDNEHKWVRIGGDTLSGNLTVQYGGDACVYAINSNTSSTVILDAGSGQEHGIWTRGYYNGSSFVSSPQWMIYRNGAGTIIANGQAMALRDRGNGSDITARYSSGGVSSFSYGCVWNGYQITYISKADMQSQIRRPMTGDTDHTPSDTNTCLSAAAGYELAHGYARDNRVKYFNLSPAASTTVEIKSANSGYVVIWRLGTVSTYGIKFGTGTSVVNMLLSGTDYCSVTDNMQTVTIKNTHSSSNLRGFIFSNSYPGIGTDD